MITPCSRPCSNLLYCFLIKRKHYLMNYLKIFEIPLLLILTYWLFLKFLYLLLKKCIKGCFGLLWLSPIAILPLTVKADAIWNYNVLYGKEPKLLFQTWTRKLCTQEWWEIYLGFSFIFWNLKLKIYIFFQSLKIYPIK